MSIDRRLQEQVLTALERELGVDAAQVGVSARDGVVTLHGLVPTFRQKWLAERAARRLREVRAVANDLEVVRLDAPANDALIAQAVADAIDWDDAVPTGRVKATVRHGWVTLTGTATWQFQRAAAERAAARVAGVKGVSNSIVVESEISVPELHARIEAAFRQAAEIDAHAVAVEAHAGTVVLSGIVHSANERAAAERAVLATPGVARVDDRLVVAP
jgi:osmotically-inducible protein OsmY